MTLSGTEQSVACCVVQKSVVLRQLRGGFFDIAIRTGAKDYANM